MNGDRCPRGIFCCKVDEPPSGTRKLREAKRRKRRWLRRRMR